MMVKSKEPEEWKDVVGYEGLYQISSIGRVKTLISSYGLLNPHISKNGYPSIGLRKNKICKTKLIHRLIAEAFIPNPNNFNIVNHIDGKRKNSFLSNLEWCTQKHNIQEAVRLNLIKPHAKGKFGKDNKLSKPLLQKNLLGKLVQRWDSLMDCIRSNPTYSFGNISAVCAGKRKSHKNYIWEYEQ